MGWIRKIVGLSATFIILLLFAGCVSEEQIRKNLPREAQNAELEYLVSPTFGFCTVASYKPLGEFEFKLLTGKERNSSESGFIKGPIKNHISETSIIYRVIGKADESCKDPRLLRDNSDSYYDYLYYEDVYIKYERGRSPDLRFSDSIVIYDAQTERLIYFADERR